METNIETLVAEENWRGLEYFYHDADEETRLRYAYHFGTAHLVVQPWEKMVMPEFTENMVDAFRISLYDKRIAENIIETHGGFLYKFMNEIEKRAREYTIRGSTSEPDAADNSRIACEHYMLLYFLYSSRQSAQKALSKEKTFLIESGVASIMNDKYKYKAAWESLMKLIVNLKETDDHFIEAIISFFRLFNTVDITRKNNQSGFTGYLLEHKELFSEEEVSKLTDFQNELQKECMLIFFEIMLGREDYKKRMLDSKIQRAEEVKQFAFKYANCPENLDTSYFKETQVNKKARELMAQSKPDEAFNIIIDEYKTGIPKNSFLIREVLNEIVALLFENTGKIDYVVKALKIDQGNEKMKGYLMR
jgi:hypothetical protein